MPLHVSIFCGNTLCIASYYYVLHQRALHLFICLHSVATHYKNLILFYSVAAHYAPLQLYYILWQHSAPLHYAAYCGNTMHHFILLYSMATHYVPLHSAYPFAAHYALLHSAVTIHYPPLHMTVFYGKSLCIASYDSILWQQTMRNFILLYSLATHYACL
jgi:hypothetical protein